MRHRRKINHLSRKSAHRKAMMANMASSLILHKRIHTTVAKAKALRTYVEPLITKSKLSVTTKTSVEEASHLRRSVFSYLQNKDAVTELFREVSSKVAERPGGYTRIIKTGTRLGDNAEMCMMELVDYNENLLEEKTASEGKSKRRRRGGKKKAEGTPAEATTAAVATGATAVEDNATEEEPVVASEGTEDPAVEEVEPKSETEEAKAADAKAEEVEDAAEVADAPAEEKKDEPAEAKTEPADKPEEEKPSDENKEEKVEAKKEEVPEAKAEEAPEEKTEESPEETKDDKEDSEKKES